MITCTTVPENHNVPSQWFGWVTQARGRRVSDPLLYIKLAWHQLLCLTTTVRCFASLISYVTTLTENICISINRLSPLRLIKTIGCRHLTKKNTTKMCAICFE